MLKLYMEYQLRPVSTACGLDRLGTGLKTAKDRVRPTKTGSLRLRSSLLCFPNLEDRSRSRSFKFGPKDRTGPDFKALIETHIDNEDELLIAYVQGENIADLCVNKTNIATELAKKDAEKKETKTLEEIIPSELLKYKTVFDEVEANIFPESRSWDHAINLKDDFIPKDCPIYPLL